MGNDIICIYIYSYSVCIKKYYHFQKFETPSLGQTQLQYIDAATWQPKLAAKTAAMMFHPLFSCMNDQAMVNSMSGFGFLGSPGFPFYPFWDSHSGYLIETTGPTTKPNHWLKRRSLERHVLQRVVDCPSPGCRTLRWFSEFSGLGGRNFQSCRVLEKKGPFWSNAAPRQIHVILFP